MLTSRYAATLAGTLANVLESFVLPLFFIDRQAAPLLSALPGLV